MEEKDSTVCNIADLHRRNNKAVDYYIHWGTCDTCHKKDQYPLCTIFDTFPEQTVSTRYQLHCVKEALHRSEQRGRRSQLLDEIRTEARYRIYDDVEREVRANLGLNMSRRLKKAIHKRALELTETYRWKEKHFNDLHRQVEQCAQSLEKNIHTLRKQKIYLQSKLFEATGVAYTEPTSLRNAWDEEPEIEIDQTIRLIQEKLNEFVNSDSE